MSKDAHSLAIDIRRDASTVEVQLRGEIDLRNSPRLRSALVEVAGLRPKRVILDLSNVSYVDSSGMGTIVEFRRKLDPAGGALILAGLQPRVRSVLEITRLDHFFRLAETIDEARKA